MVRYCYVVQNSLLWKGGKKHSKNTAPFPLPRQKKKKKVLDLTERGKPNDMADRILQENSSHTEHMIISENCTF